MTTSHEDLAERIDASFGAGPDSPPSLDLLLSRGRRTQRRRRVAVGGIAATAVAVVVSGSLLLAPGDDHTRDGAYVGTPTPTAAPSSAGTAVADPSTTPTLGRAKQLRLMGRAVTFGDHGEVTPAPGALILEQIDDPYGSVPPAWSVALRVSYHGFEFWTVDYGPGDGSSTGDNAGPDPTGSFSRFIADQAPVRTDLDLTNVGPDVWPDVVPRAAVHMDEDTTTLVAERGFQVLDQRDHVDAGRAWADPSAPGEETAAALVRGDDGTSYFVLARRFDAKSAQYVVVPQAGNGDDLAAFLDLARQRYAAAR